MSYFKFLIKKVIKNKFNLIPLIILFILSFGVLILNYTAAQNSKLSTLISGNQKNAVYQMETAKTQLDNTNKNSDQYTILKEEISGHRTDAQYWKKAEQALKENNWAQTYQNINKATANFRESTTNSHSAAALKNTGVLEAIQHDYLLYKALEVRNLPYEAAGFPIKGITYSVTLAQFYMPIVFYLGIIFVLVSIFTSAYVEKINISALFPSNRKSSLISSVGAGTSISVVIYGGVLLISFLLATILFGTSSLSYPIDSYHFLTKELYFQNIGNIIIPSLILTILAMVIVVQIAYLVSYLFRERLASLFVTLILVIGLSLSTTVIEPLQRVAQFLPTTYLNSVSVVTGLYAHNINNFSVSFEMGIVSLLVWIAIIGFCTIFITKRVKKY